MKNKILAIGMTILFLITIVPSYQSTGLDKIIKACEKSSKDIEVFQENDLYVPGEIIVEFKNPVNTIFSNENIPSTGIESLDNLNSKYSVSSMSNLGRNDKSSILRNHYKIEFSEKIDPIKVSKDYQKDQNIIYAEPNYIYKTCSIPNDPYFDFQWGLNQSNDNDIDAPEAWDIEKGSSDIVIAIIDSGVDYNHSDLSDNIWINEDEIIDGTDSDGNGYIDDIRGYDFVDKAYNADPSEDGLEEDNDPMDNHGHGTHCAGIAAGVGNNGIGITGVSWNSKIMAVRAGYKATNGNGYFNLGAILLSISYAVDNGADIISMSFGGPLYSYLQRNAFISATNRGVFLVAAAGNEGSSERSYPAAYKEVLSVAATNEKDKRAYFSNYGDWVEVAAPGVNICSTVPNNTYENYSGTSMACPCVAGLAALIKSKNNSLNPQKIREIINYSSDRLNFFDINRGRVNARNALLRGTGNVKALITSPKHGSEIKGEIEISGKAYGQGFQRYILEYAKGNDIESNDWIELVNSETEIENGLIHTLNTSNIDDGDYIIRLKVICDDGQYSDHIGVLINNIKDEYIVDDDGTTKYKHIQDAIEDCGDGDTVRVLNGTYIENVAIYHSINLIGENNENTIIDTGGFGNCISVYTDNVNITGFNLTNTSSFYSGIYMQYADNCIISCNNFENNFFGIKIDGSQKNIITKNKFLLNIVGIRVIDNSNKNIFSYNNFLIVEEFPSFLSEEASYRNSRFNKWKHNFWERERILPKRIVHRIFDYTGIFLPGFFHRCNFDWFPAKIPNEIPPTGIITNTRGDFY